MGNKISEKFVLTNGGSFEFQNVVEKGISYDSTYPFTSYDGKRKWIRTIANAVKENEKIISVLAVVIDVTEQKQYEKELMESKKAAEEATKAKSEFLSNMSHEIRTPMNAIIGMSNLALEEELGEKAKNYIKKTNSAAENLLHIINDILDFSKIEAGKLTISNTHFEFINVITNTINLINISAKDKNLKTKVKIDKDLPRYFFSDPFRIGQVLSNLANNAVKFSKPDGSIIISASLQKENEDSAVVQFSVEDEGIGISKEDQKKLFKPFSQADASTTRKYGGTGLGLAISKRIVELMDGTIWVQSEEGMGSTFYFSLKMKKSDKNLVSDMSEKMIDATNNINTELNGKKVLLVEDNELNQELALDLLKRDGFDVTLANNGKEALKRLEMDMFDVVLMDCQMPILDGYETTKEIRKQDKYKDLPIIAMTANAMQGDREKAIDAGMNDYIAKPVDPKIMFETISKWI